MEAHRAIHPTLMSLRSLMPWYARIGAKLVLSRLPAAYFVWHRLGYFSHGAMDRPDYAHRVFRQHFDAGTFPRKAGGFVGLELGPGDSALSAVAARAYGAAAWHLVDAGRFATPDLAPYRAMADMLRLQGRNAPDLANAGDLDAVLSACGAHYGTTGLRALQALVPERLDLVWSQAVLEHVRRGEFLQTMQALRRALRPGGLCSHTVDLRDHLGGGLNNMRLRSPLWESPWMVRSGFYTNRLRLSEMLALFREAGFAPQVTRTAHWESPPLPRHKLALEFRGLPDDDLLVREFDVLLRPA